MAIDLMNMKRRVLLPPGFGVPLNDGVRAYSADPDTPGLARGGRYNNDSLFKVSRGNLTLPDGSLGRKVSLLGRETVDGT